MKCIIIAIGTEVVSGDIINTNAAFISDYLKRFGIKTIQHLAILDNEKHIVRALKDSLLKAELIITTGGLGPTYDDITKIAIAKALKLPLYKDEESLESIKSFFRKLGREMTENNERQAYFPKNSIIVENKNGTAPACITKAAKKSFVIMLPGPPSEMIPLMESNTIVEFLNQTKTEEIFETRLKFFGIGESSLEEKLKEHMVCTKSLILAPYAKTGEVELKITAKAKTIEEAESKANELRKNIYLTVGEYIYTEGEKSLEEVLIDNLKTRNLKLITAESCTGGLIAEKITSIPGSSEVFKGGLVTYSNDLKMSLLDVSRKTLEEFGAVSRGTAIEMAEGARYRYNADIAISVTGIAGPDGGTEEKPIGLVYIGISTAEKTEAVRFNFTGNREKIREITAKNAIHMALTEIWSFDPPARPAND